MNGDESIKEKEGRMITKGIEGGGVKAKLKVPFIKIYIAFSLRPALTINRFVAQEIPTLFFTFFHLHFVPRFPKKMFPYLFFSLYFHF